jgi:hypothetical protein
MIFDWYEHIDGQPMTVIIQVNAEEQKEKEKRTILPSYLRVAKEITDMPEFQSNALCRADFKMSDENKALTKQD